ncbi:hypothetical protein CDD81_1765 [Ophiocordyceps australis]|uniref:Carrier domain-containing protein n=1 Tax=Ophiocordyceps australis TaxID=1399860 RepID=A0A2C5XB64_9HYPO|nr:hypothetical protein CDD81_1765 [Ophiocordyceps australis]
MSSSGTKTPPWQGWDSCCVLSAKENGLKNSSPLVSKLQDAFDAQSLLKFCRDNKVSREAVLELAWCILVGAYTGLEDVCAGVVVNGTEKVVRCRLDAQQSARRHVLTLEEVDLEARCMLDVVSGGLLDTILVLDTSDAKTKWVNSLSPPDGSGIGHIEAQVDLDKATISISNSFTTPGASWSTRAASLFSKCIADIILCPNEPLGSLDLLPPADAKQIQSWNSKDLGTHNSCLHHVIRQRAEETPDSVAVCAWDGDLTYRDLDLVSSHVAWKLHSLGVDRGSVVAFLFGKSKWTIVSLLAIIKAGGAAVALNADFPLERCKHILEVTRACVLVVAQDLEQSIDLDAAVTKLVVDEAHFPIAASSDARDSFTSPTVKPDDLAYIQFTSGSTGQPKGMMIEHRNYLASAKSQHQACRVNKQSRVLQFASHSFDAILVEVMTPLLAGACVCIPSDERRLNDLAGAIRDFDVNWMGLTPTLTRVIKPADVPGLETLCTWGEEGAMDIIETWADAVELINIYGPSETSVESTAHSWSRGIRDTCHLGKPLPTVNTWIVRIDNREKLAAIGAVGELAFQGPHVTRGYLHGPADSFRNHVPWLPPGEREQRIYYSGDLVRYTADGSLEFCGRRDTQVKIRGHRIELGEIEHHIKQNLQGEYTTSVVEVIRPGYRPAQKIVVAFLAEQRHAVSSNESPLRATSPESRAQAAELEKQLAQFLPRHFVPELYLPLEYLPTSASGKADRRKLRTTAEALSERELQSYSSHTSTKRLPQTDTEIKVARLWGEILGLDYQEIGLEDSFFWLGGNSILAMKLAVGARKQGMPVTVAQVLNNARLGQLCAVMASESAVQPDQAPSYTPFSTLPSKVANSFVSRVAAPLLGVDEANVQDAALATDYQVENLAWSSLKTRGGTNYITFDFDAGVDASCLCTAIERLVEHHDILRTVYLVYERRVYQVALKKLAFDIVDCPPSKDVAGATSALVEADSGQPVDISRALVKFWLVRNDEDQVKCLVMRASHLQYDGVSLIRLCKELCLALDQEPLLPTTPFYGYMHFAATNEQDGAREFWRKTLAGSAMTDVLQHTSIPWKHVLDGQVETVIDTATMRSDSDITIGTTIKAAWALVLAEMSGTSDVVFGSVIWGRNAMYAGVEQVTGPCIDNIPVRVQLSSGMTRRQVLQQVQRQYFEAVSHESFQYKRIVQECTDWAPWQRLSSLVEYENLGEETARFEMQGSGNGLVVNEVRPPADRHDITIFSTPLGAHQTFIALDFCKAAVSEPLAQSMLDALVARISDFHSHLDETVELVSQQRGLPRIPMTLPCSVNGLHQGHADDAAKEPHAQTRHLVQGAWARILASPKQDLDGQWTSRVPFYNVWGNLIAAYGLARCYQEAGHGVCMEDILHRPDMQSQAALLAQGQGQVGDE